MTNPYLARSKKVSMGLASEKRLAKKFKARLHPASGAMVGAKGDMTVKGKRKWLLESKATGAESMRLQLEWLRKITREANEKSAYPMVTISFTTATGLAKDYGDWVLMPRWALQDLVEDFDQ